MLADEGAACGSGGSTTWNSIGAPTNNATFSNAGYSTTFNQTSAANWTWANTTGATSSASQDSPIWNLSGQYWNGTASASDTWSFQDQLSNTSPYDDTLAITHSGTSGLSAVTFFGSPGTAGAVVLQNCGRSTCNAIAADDNGGVARFSVSGSGGVGGASFGLNNGDWSVSTSGAVTAASYTAGGNSVPVYTGSITAGDCAKWSASGVLADQGAACGSGGSGLPSSWSVGTGNAVTATTTTDVVPFTIYPYTTGTTSDLFDVCSGVTSGACSGTKYFAINSNGNMVLSATNMTWGTVGMQSTTGAYNALAGGIGQASYNVFYAAGLMFPAFGNSNLTTNTTDGNLPASTTYTFVTTFTSTRGSGFETSASNVGTIQTGSGTATNTITITFPAQTSGSATLKIYDTTNGTLCGVETYSGASWTSDSCSITGSTSTTVTISSIASTPAGTPPNSNNTGATGIMSYLYPSINFSGALGVSGSAPGQDFGVLQAALTTNGIATVYTSGSNTTQNDLMCFSASETASQCAASSTLSNFAGVSLVAGNSTTLVQYSGVATIALASSAMTTYDDAACTNATAGTVVDAGAATCSSGTQVGIIAQTNGTPVTSVPVYLKPASGASTTEYVLNPNGSGQTHMANVANVVRVGTFYLPVSVSFSDLSILVGTADTVSTDYYSWGIYSTSGTALCTIGTSSQGIALTTAGLYREACQQTTPVTLSPGTYVFMTTGSAAVALLDTGNTHTISLLSSNTAGTSSNGAAPSSLSLTSGIIDDSGAVATAVIGMN